MMYKIKVTPKFDKELSKLDPSVRKHILKYINTNLKEIENPRAFGKALVGDKKGLWRYRIGNYRLICEIQDQELILLLLTIGHRREVYK